MQNPYTDFSSVNPQREDGHREIETSIFQALTRAGLSGLEYSLVLLIIDKTWGWNKTEDMIPLVQFVEGTQQDKSYIIRGLKSLEKRHIIVVQHVPGGGRGRGNVYMFNKHWDTWLTGPLKETVTGSHPLEPVTAGRETVPDSHPLPSNSAPESPFVNGDQESPFDAGKGDKSAGKGDLYARGKGDHTSPSIETIETLNRKKDIKTPSSEAIELAKLLKGLISRNNPKAKTPDDITKWAADMDRMLKIDHRTPEEVKYIIEFSQNDSFWCANILSAGKLRDKFDQLYLRAKEKEKSSAEKKEKGGSHAGREPPRQAQPRKHPITYIRGSGEDEGGEG